MTRPTPSPTPEDRSAVRSFRPHIILALALFGLITLGTLLAWSPWDGGGEDGRAPEGGGDNPVIATPNPEAGTPNPGR